MSCVDGVYGQKLPEDGRNVEGPPYHAGHQKVASEINKHVLLKQRYLLAYVQYVCTGRPTHVQYS